MKSELRTTIAALLWLLFSGTAAPVSAQGLSDLIRGWSSGEITEGNLELEKPLAYELDDGTYSLLKFHLDKGVAWFKSRRDVGGEVSYGEVYLLREEELKKLAQVTSFEDLVDLGGAASRVMKDPMVRMAFESPGFSATVHEFVFLVPAPQGRAVLGRVKFDFSNKNREGKFGEYFLRRVQIRTLPIENLR